MGMFEEYAGLVSQLTVHERVTMTNLSQNTSLQLRGKKETESLQSDQFLLMKNKPIVRLLTEGHETGEKKLMQKFCLELTTV